MPHWLKCYWWQIGYRVKYWMLASVGLVDCVRCGNVSDRARQDRILCQTCADWLDAHVKRLGIKAKEVG